LCLALPGKSITEFFLAAIGVKKQAPGRQDIGLRQINCHSSLDEKEPNVRVDIRSPTNDRQEAGPGSAEVK
jgi:hypothetical protein